MLKIANHKIFNLTSFFFETESSNYITQIDSELVILLPQSS
jgi:hypothetical protein